MTEFRILGISENTIEALRAKGFEEPSPIQAATIPILLRGERDVVGQAQTGTGKTAAFAIPIIDTLEPAAGHVQAVVLAPTRELAVQIAVEFNSLKGGKKLEVVPIYGGQAIEVQIGRLKRGVDVVVGTPGRIMDLMRRRCLKLDQVEFAVLDEADEMLSMGFVEDIETILGATPEDKRTLMFSATMPPAILGIAEKFMRGYETIRIKERLATSLTEQIYFEVRREDKLEALCRIVDVEADFYALVFCRTRNDVDELCDHLLKRGYSSDALHGDFSQAQRSKVVERFRRRAFNILIATDVAARGLDIEGLTHVINYSIPQSAEAYVHRVGRTGRAGKTGNAITFVTPSEYRGLTQIQRIANASIAKKTLPGGADVVRLKKNRVMEELSSLVENESYRDCLGFADELLAEGDAREILAALLKRTFKEELSEENYREIGVRHPKRQVDETGIARLFVARGKNDGFFPKQILELLRSESGINPARIGKITCLDTFSFVSVPFEEAEEVIASFQEHARGRAPLVRLAKESPEEAGAGKGAKKTKDGGGADRKFGKPFAKKYAKPAGKPAGKKK